LGHAAGDLPRPVFREVGEADDRQPVRDLVTGAVAGDVAGQTECDVAF
jgi:hypothetical protein